MPKSSVYRNAALALLLALPLALPLVACVDGDVDGDDVAPAEDVDAGLPTCADVCGAIGYHCDGQDFTECSCNAVSVVVACLFE